MLQRTTVIAEEETAKLDWLCVIDKDKLVVCYMRDVKVGFMLMFRLFPNVPFLRTDFARAGSTCMLSCDLSMFYFQNELYIYTNAGERLNKLPLDVGSIGGFFGDKKLKEVCFHISFAGGFLF